MRIKLYADNPNYRDVKLIVDALRSGEVAICPTSSGYTYVCDALQTRAVETLCKIKRIDPKKKALSLLFKDMSQLSEYCKLSDDAFKFIREHTGEFTFILPPASTLPKIFKHRKEVGARLDENPICKLIISELGNPLITSSLPIEDEDPEYATDPELVEERFGWEVSLILDNGICGNGPTTIIDCTKEPFEIVRQGQGLI